ncbi:MAG: glycosyl hydrolase-related protein, partial [Armatimonadota bacterium]
SGYDPDPAPDMGLQSASYSIYPHKGIWQESDTVKRGYEFNNPLIPVATTSHEGKLPKTHSFLKVDKANIIVTALKKAEDSNDMILRFYECKGETGNAKISFGMNVKSVQETDLSERPGKNAKSKISGSSMTVPFGKWEIKALKLSNK